MHLRTALPRFAAALTLLLGAATTAFATPTASADNNIEWSGVSHVTWQDCRPLCPVNGESFQVRFQTWGNDITSARVHLVVGASSSNITASKIGRRGPYDIWAATIPATAQSSENYWIELTDGTLTDYLSVNGLTHATPVDGGFAVNFTTLSHAPVGATPVTGGCVFKVWAPTRTSCYVRGTFNAWGMTAPLTKQGEYFVGRVTNVPDRSEYKYFFNNSVWNTDPRARALNVFGGGNNAYVENPFRYSWGDSNFTIPNWDRLVVYQLHIGTFAGYNDPAGATAFPSGYRDVGNRAAYLAQLGVNAVQVCPWVEFPGDLSAGYNPITQWAPEWKYGTPDDLKFMIDKLHQNGIAVLLDLVWNHFSPTDNFLWNYDGTQTYFDTPQVDTPWGAQANFGIPAVADYFAHSSLYWFQEFHVDGYRMDATAYMNPGVHAASGWALMQRLNNEKYNRWADKITIAENLPNNEWVSKPSVDGGAGFDSQYHMLFRDAVRNAIFTSAFGDPDMNSVRSGLLGSGQYINYVKALNYVQLHDEAWPSSGGQRLVKTIDSTYPSNDDYAKGRSKLAEGLVLTSPAIPEMLQGDEWLEDIGFGAESTNRIDWSKKTLYAPIFQYYQRLNFLRRTLPALSASASIYVSHVNESGNVIGFRRWDNGGNNVMVIANFSNTDFSNYRIGVPEGGVWMELVNSQDPLYGGAGATNGLNVTAQNSSYDGFSNSVLVNVPRMSLIVLGPKSTVGVDTATPRPSSLELSLPFPNPTRGAASMTFALPQAGRVRLAVHDLSGRLVRQLADADYAPGRHGVAWDGRDAAGHAAAPGLYFVRLNANGAERVARLTMLR
ncbi:MAG: alpha amylase C-terminal domain-containing protein [Candidatus Eisenbacteria bacterium]|nr:alpha amylase C-terminal domain-containing protein [Candidatus Eisenbacteria bacterium]